MTARCEHAVADHHFNFARDHAHAQSAPHQLLQSAMRVRARPVLPASPLLSDAHGEHARQSCVGALNAPSGIQVNDAGGNIFEHGFHQLAAALEFLHGLLKVACELVDLRAAVAQLRGHGVERADQHAEFVLRLFGNLILEIAGGNFARALGKRLNGHGNLLGEEQRDPGGGGKNQKREEEEDQQHLPFEGAQILLHVFVFLGLRLDGGPALQKVGTGAITGNQRAFGVVRASPRARARRNSSCPWPARFPRRWAECLLQ